MSNPFQVLIDYEGENWIVEGYFITHEGIDAERFGHGPFIDYIDDIRVEIDCKGNYTEYSILNLVEGNESVSEQVKELALKVIEGLEF